MINVYIDQDGVLAKWSDSPLEEVQKEGYFLSRELEEVMKEVIDILSKDSRIKVHLLSSVWCDGHSEFEKRAWIKDKGVNIEEGNLYFVPSGTSKSDWIKQNIGASEKDVLVDDFSENLRAWHGRPIKFRNGINGTKGTWKGDSVCVYMSAAEIAKEITRFA